jgi:hypothetical protein
VSIDPVTYGECAGLRRLLWQQLRPGARIVSNDFGMGDWAPDSTVRVETPDRTYTLYRWTITQALKDQMSGR